MPRRITPLVWRINAYIILFTGLMAGLVLCVVAFLMVRDATRTRHVDHVANTVVGDVRASTSALGGFEAIAGTAVLRAPLTVQQTYALGSGSKEAGSTRNYFYFDPSARSGHWLLSDTQSVILSSSGLPASARYGDKAPAAVAFVHQVVDKDTSGDDRLSDADARHIAISAPDGTGYRVLVRQADRMNHATLLSPRQLLILYAQGTSLRAIEVDPTDASAPATEYEVPTALKQAASIGILPTRNTADARSAQ